jgi:hypothetical protein
VKGTGIAIASQVICNGTQDLALESGKSWSVQTDNILGTRKYALRHNLDIGECFVRLGFDFSSAKVELVRLAWDLVVRRGST